MDERVCRTCSRVFTPSSGHLDCPACRSKAVCSCGGPRQKSSSVCTSCADRSGARNANWKGGTTRHNKGYVMIKAWDHPRAGPQGYVFEHVLVMEAMIGRYLRPGETVHHLNGLRADNRPENLELWTRPQPSGIRAVDAVAWALTVLEEYGDLVPDARTRKSPRS